MTTITSTVKQFKSMFNTIMCGSKYPLFDNVILEIDNESISVNGMDQTRAIGTNQKYTGFTIEGSDNIPLDTTSIYEAINLFNDNDPLTLEYSDNGIVLSVDSNGEKDTIRIPTPNIDDINNNFPITFTENSIINNNNEMKFVANVIVDTKYIQNQIKKANFVSSMYHEYAFSINENKLILTVGDPNNYETSASTEIEVRGNGIANSMYAHGYDDVFKALSGDVVIHINDNKPMLVVQTRDNYSIKYLIAPTIKE